MHKILYTSHAAKPMSQDELTEILEKARTKNRQLEITGMLVYFEGNFVQLLEGEKSKIDALYDTIRQDERHSHLFLIDEVETPVRSFPNWQMAFKKLSDEEVAKHPTLKGILENDAHKPTDIDDIVDLFISLIS